MIGGVATGVAGAADTTTGVASAADPWGVWSCKMKDWWQHDSETSFPCRGPMQLVSIISTEKSWTFVMAI